MNWIIISLIAIGILGVSDLFRKLASNLKDPFFTNLVFQFGATSAAIILYLIFSIRPFIFSHRDLFIVFK